MIGVNFQKPFLFYIVNIFLLDTDQTQSVTVNNQLSIKHNNKDKLSLKTALLWN